MPQELWKQLDRRARQVVDRAIRSYAAASPLYQGTIPEHLSRHMAHSTHEFVRLYLRMIEQGREPRDDEVQTFADRGKQRGAEGLPIADFMDAYLQSAQVLWDELTRLASPNPPPPAAAEVLLRCLQRVMHAGFQAHQEEYQAARSEERETMRAAVRALVGGQLSVEITDHANLRLADSYSVLALRVAAHPSESVGDAVGRRLAGRRKAHRITEELLRSLPDDALVSLDPDGGLALLPSTPGNATTDLAAARAALPKLRRTAEVEITTGFAHAATRAEVPNATTQARQLAALGNPSQVAVLDDYLFEYHLHHPSEAVPRLLAIANKLRNQPDLLETLQEYFDTDLNRRQTASHLHVHPNTIDNRLSRIAAETGANPRTTRGLLVLGAALNISTTAETPPP